MAQSLCQLKKKGGGKMSETTLWTNSSQSSAFSIQTVQLSQDVSSFTYLKYTFAYSTSALGTVSSYVIDISDYNASTAANGHMYTLMGSDIAGNVDARCIYKVDNTHAMISDCYRLGGTEKENNYVIPISIKGLK